ncbi:MAG: hypothetical protein K0S73_1897 [Stenotrophomonas rhizophila]|jgi:hypothetical protein|uniref:hypothetical protein n=1 Tax=Stenotrophomonas TaxID=40323 RepID=UPI000B84ECBA|nr:MULTISPECIES: hypothetical protein [Stenotrophomonas]MDF2817957.1 hypothetical protein [Stenotrophomonas rhizophila]MDQ1061397.1 hypothetical protein [Stenotrophomonas sp. SORGH_AS_0282]MDQ1190253.1 hypothetical protein [Stenotrophomonas sp. SORGH_AS_0282]MDY0979947.1 hypothetical protein [Stenotrophomonas sp. CFBP8994]UQY87153.1 hypothetical protein LQE85_16970 [Stenotrophomonas rhizophila]
MTLSSSRRSRTPQPGTRALQAPDPRILRGVRQVALAGLAVVLVWPAARGSSEWVGWLPMWLVGMPCLAWWSLYRFRLPTSLLAWQARRRRGPQARRRVRRAAPRLRPDLRQGGAGQAV